jgi:ABC-2 type transport system ATP-binding protein
MTTLATSERSATTRTGISIRHLDKSYGPLDVLEDLALDLAPDRVYGLLGPNGAGKTTLMSVICNHTFRSGGTILIDGEDPAENAPVLARMCFIHEDQPYNDAFSVASILATMPAFYPGWDEALCQRLVGRFRLPVQRPSRKLSRGQKSALAIVISLASRAPYTFLDEPYLGLDPTAREIFYEELLTDIGDHPRTVIMSTHLIDEAADLMEEVIVLHQGKVVLQADVDEARSSAFVARGLTEDVREFAAGRETIAEHALGRILSATIGGRVGAADEQRATERRIALEPASLQDLIAALGIQDLTTALTQENR